MERERRGKRLEIERDAEERSSHRWGDGGDKRTARPRAPTTAANREARASRTVVRRRGEREEREGEIRDEMGIALGQGIWGTPLRGGFSAKCQGYFYKIVRLPCSCQNKIYNRVRVIKNQNVFTV